MMQRLVYSKFSLASLPLDELDKAELEPYPTRPDSMFRWKIVFSEPACQIVVEDWFKGHDIEWTYWIDTIMYVISGEGEIELWQPPNWVEKHLVTAKAGDVFLCPRGARAIFRTTSDDPFRRLVIDIPNAGYDAEELAAGTAERAESGG